MWSFSGLNCATDTKSNVADSHPLRCSGRSIGIACRSFVSHGGYTTTGDARALTILELYRPICVQCTHSRGTTRASSVAATERRHPPTSTESSPSPPVSRMSSHVRSLDHDTLSAEASRAHEQCDATSNARVLGIAGLAWPAGSGGFCGHASAHKSERERVASRQPRDGRDDACVRYLRFLAVHDELHMRTFAHATLAPYTRPMTA